MQKVGLEEGERQKKGAGKVFDGPTRAVRTPLAAALLTLPYGQPETVLKWVIEQRTTAKMER